MAEFRLNYGRNGVSLDLPDSLDVTLVRKPSMPKLRDPQAAARAALREPVGCEPLSVLAKRASKACIVICDITRPVPNHLFLRPIIEEMMNAGLPADNITVLIATGLHRPNLGEELEELVGDRWVLDRVRVLNHDAREDSQHAMLGTTQTRGTVVRLNRALVDADLRIATGLVEPHFMAGYSGGRKVIAPGVAHAETITTFHSARFMADPATRNCNFENNPLHEEQLEIVRMLGGAYAINTVIDEQRNLSFINFGEIIESHRQAVGYVRDYCEIEYDRPFDIVVTSAAGYPLDKTYYQTVKGMVGAMDILKPGGDLIIASDCSEGLGSEEYIEAQKRLVAEGPDVFLESILKKSHADIDEWQTQMQLKPSSKGNLRLYSTGLSQQEHAWTGVEQVTDLRESILECASKYRQPAIAVIPEGPYVVPRLSNDVAGDISSNVS